jgi:general secretion pathway protein I
MRRHTPARSFGSGSAKGFTLLEVLLAFVVFAISFAIVLEILSSSMRSTVRARDYSEAALMAQSLMDMVGSEFPLEDSVYDGETGNGFRWTVDIVTWVPDSDVGFYVLDIADANGTLIFRIDVDLEWGEGSRSRQARFTTIRPVLEGRR